MAVTSSTLEELVRAEFAGMTAFNAYLTSVGRDPGTAVFPRAGASPGASTPTPFVVIRYGPEVGDVLLAVVFDVYIYDDPHRRFWRVEDLKNIIRRHFDRRLLGPTIAGATHYYIVYHELTTARDVDPDWEKNFQSVRFNTYGAY